MLSPRLLKDADTVKRKPEGWTTTKVCTCNDCAWRNMFIPATKYTSELTDTMTWVATTRPTDSLPSLYRPKSLPCQSTRTLKEARRCNRYMARDNRGSRMPPFRATEPGSNTGALYLLVRQENAPAQPDIQRARLSDFLPLLFVAPGAKSALACDSSLLFASLPPMVSRAMKESRLQVPNPGNLSGLGIGLCDFSQFICPFAK
jgi:hypothetical protein